MTRVEGACQLLEGVFGEIETEITSASNAWKRAPAPDEWAPKQVAEHVISAMLIYLDFAADALERAAFDWESLPYDLETPQIARKGLDTVRDYASTLLMGLEDTDLDRDVPAMGDWPNLPPTVEGCIGYCHRHGLMHAGQIREALTSASDAV
jgi:hypothetical protein